MLSNIFISGQGGENKQWENLVVRQDLVRGIKLLIDSERM